MKKKVAFSNTIIHQVAKENGTTPREVRHEMKRAIALAYNNPRKSLRIKRAHAATPRAGRIPTVEEFLLHILNEVEKAKADRI